MKKNLFLIAIAAVTFASCTSDELVNGQATLNNAGQTPIGFNVRKQNITRAALEDVNHYNFGVWAYKVNTSPAAQEEVMNHYLVGWSNGTNKGYDPTNATTFSADADHTGSQADHTDYLSPWFYEGLGTSQYTSAGAGYYQPGSAYMSANTHQYLRYWDLAFEKTNFYCYAPYNTTVTFNATSKVMTFADGTTIQDGYDNPQNTAYSAIDRSLSEYMYGSKSQNNKMTGDKPQDVDIAFKHMGAQLFIRFYEDVPGYRVEIIDLDQDRTGYDATQYAKNGIQAVPAVKTAGTPDTYAKGYYYKKSGATIDFSDLTNVVFTPTFTTAASKVQDRLMFKIPTSTSGTAGVTPNNLSVFKTTHYVIPQSGDGTYAYSPTIYYPIAQPTTGTAYTDAGFTFHVSYRVIAEDNGEVITVHDAAVHVPVKGDAASTDGGATTANQWITAWQSNTKYTYTFKITKGTSGTTDPTVVPDPDDANPGTTKALFPIVFDNATIEDYTNSFSEYNITDGTAY